MSLALREAGEADAPLLAQLYAWHVLHGVGTFAEEPPPSKELERRRRVVADRGLPWLIAELDGRPAGFAYAAPYRDRSAYRYTAEDSVYVAPDAWGRGVGRALLEAVMERCVSAGLRRMIASIGDSRNLGSIRLHQRCGFQHCGRLSAVGYKHDRWLDVVWMERALG